MRTVSVLFFLIITFCNRFARSEQHQNNNFRYNKAKDFVDEQQSLTKAEDITSEEEFKDQENNDNRLRDVPSRPVFRHKSSQEVLRLSPSLQRSYQRSLPLLLARQQSTDVRDDRSVGDVYFVAHDNRVSDVLSGPVMRRKSSEEMLSPSLQRSDQRSLPLPLARQQSTDVRDDGSLGDVYFVAIVACVSAVAIFGVIGAGICVYKVQQSNKAAADVEYPAYGVVGPASKQNNSGNISPNGDRKLAQSAQMYHYHHQKQQMIASEKAVTNRRNSASDVESDEENEEGEYTVYECPGLAPTGEMEVKNPLFHDDITPVSSPSVAGNNTKDK